MEGERDFFDFNNLPDDILCILFSYLSIPESRIFGQVCKKWYKISRDPDSIFWKKVVVFFERHRKISTNVRTMKLLKMLTQSISCLELYYEHTFDKSVSLTLSEFSSTLLKMCPNLEELIIDDTQLIDTENFNEINLSNALPQKLRTLKLRKCQTTEKVKLIFDDSYSSKIEVFDLSKSDNLNIDTRFLLQMPSLRELHLGSKILEKDFVDSIPHSVIGKLNILDVKLPKIFDDEDLFKQMFQVVRNNGFNLAELYVCYTDLEDEDIVYLKDASVLPQLKIICLRGCPVTFMEINSLIDSRSSIQLVYVGNLDLSERNREEYNYSLCNSIKVSNIKEKYSYDCEHEKRHNSFRNKI